MSNFGRPGAGKIRGADVLHLVGPGDGIRQPNREERRAVQPDPCERICYTVRETAEALGVSEWFVRDEMRLGELTFAQLRGRRLIPGRELQRYVEAGIQRATGAARGEEEERDEKTRKVAAKETARQARLKKGIDDKKI